MYIKDRERKPKAHVVLRNSPLRVRQEYNKLKKIYGVTGKAPSRQQWDQISRHPDLSSHFVKAFRAFLHWDNLMETQGLETLEFMFSMDRKPLLGFIKKLFNSGNVTLQDIKRSRAKQQLYGTRCLYQERIGGFAGFAKLTEPEITECIDDGLIEQVTKNDKIKLDLKFLIKHLVELPELKKAIINNHIYLQYQESGFRICYVTGININIINKTNIWTSRVEDIAKIKALTLIMD